MKTKSFIFIAIIFSLFCDKFSQTPPQNLLINGGFEGNFNGWDRTAILDNQIKFAGNYSARFNNSIGMISQMVNVQKYTEYKVVFWVYLRNDFTGSDWGGVLCEVLSYDWQSLGSSIFINPENRERNKWHQFAIKFNSGQNNAVRLSIGFFGGSGWNASFNIDEVKLFAKSQNNIQPIISEFLVNPSSGNPPLAVEMRLSGYDIDGSVEGYYFQISDGSYYEGDSANHIFYSSGDYTITAFLRDDDGGVTSISKSVVVSGSTSFSINITAPFQGNYYQTESESVIIQGNVTAVPGEFIWFNEKNYQSGIVVLNGNNFNVAIPLKFGKNEINLQAKFSNSDFYKRTFIVYRITPNYSGPILTEFNLSAFQVETFEKFEIVFNLNTIADNFWFPYEQNLPPNLNTGNGITVDCYFQKGNRVLKFPAFYDMPYQRFNDYLLPTGKFVWKVRASFDEPGIYSILLRATDSAGTKDYQLGSVKVVESNNRGFLRVSSINDKYFEYSTGESFYGLGFNDGVERPSQIDQKINIYAQNGINLLRVWLSSISQFSDPWCSWATHHQMENNGYMNPPLYRFNRKYKNGDFSLRIAAPAIPNRNTPAIFRGFYDGGTNIKPGKNYRITVRYKLENVSGNGGFSLKLSDWAGENIVNLNVGQRIFGPVKGSTDWVIGFANFASGSNQTELPFLYAVLEGDVTGEAYIDMILLQEVYPDGSLSDNILSKWSANPHYYFDPIKCRYFDYMIERATNKNVHFKVVILEKDDYILNRIDAMGFTSDLYGNFEAPRGSKLRKLYEYYWRNIIARWGYSNAIHSYELVNEGAPGSYFEFANDFASYFDGNSPHQKLTTTSFWASWVPDYWQNSLSDYGDVHAYAMTTGFLDNGVFLGETYNRERMKNDPAALAYIYSMRIGLDPQRNKPVIIGETDFDMPGDQAPDPLLAQDTRGVWLRGFLWGHLNAGGVSCLFWDPKNLRNNNLFRLYKAPSAFFSKIPFNKTKFIEAKINLSNSNARAWGIVEENGNRAYIYSSHKNLYWRYVVTTGMPQAISTNLTIRKIAPGNYIVSILNAESGDTLQTTFAQVGADSLLSLASLILNQDAAISAINANLLDTGKEIVLPDRFYVSQNYPNPFNGTSTFEILLPKNGELKILVYDVIGRLIKYETKRDLSAGRNFYIISSDELSSGVYFLKFVFDNSQFFVKKCAVVK